MTGEITTPSGTGKHKRALAVIASVGRYILHVEIDQTCLLAAMCVVTGIASSKSM